MVALRHVGEPGGSAVVTTLRRIVGFVLVIGTKFSLRRTRAKHSSWACDRWSPLFVAMGGNTTGYVVLLVEMLTSQMPQ